MISKKNLDRNVDRNDKGATKFLLFDGCSKEKLTCNEKQEKKLWLNL
jgi:hypothetical protein